MEVMMFVEQFGVVSSQTGLPFVWSSGHIIETKPRTSTAYRTSPPPQPSGPSGCLIGK